MHRRLFAVIVALAAVTWIGAGFVSADEESDRMVEFRGRQIDLKPYIEGFPYHSFQPYYDAGKLFYYHTGETTTLRQLELTKNADLGKGAVISDVDYSTRNVWGIRYRKNDANLYWVGDERNDEVINLYQLDPRSQEISRLTDVPYIFGWRWNPEKNIVAYVGRLGDKEERLGELRLLDLASGEETKVLQDRPEFRFTWGQPSWQPQGRGVVVSVLRDADRTYGNLVYVDFEKKDWTLITDPQLPRSWPGVYKEWLSDEEFLYFSNEDGFRNVYRYNIQSNESAQITRFTRDLDDADLVTVEGGKYLLTVTGNPIENEMALVDPSTGEILHQRKIDVNVSLLDAEDDKLLASCTSAMVKFRIDEITVGKAGFSFETLVSIPAELEERIMHARVERVEYPTFDGDAATGKTRMLHAFLYHPEEPLPKDQQLVMIQSFYGGTNNFSTRTQILAEAGIYVFSPSPRGSSGFGREFSALNDKDLGGNEIVDVIYAAKYVSERLGIPPERVGVYGGSHGGYATMRCLTFPGEINGVRADFDWGFGISHAGFSDIIHFYEHCNIPDWVALEAGDPKTEAEKLRDRSPLYNADKARGTLLLTHGTNDSRVPIEGSRQMADSLRKYNKDFVLVEFEAQGHGIKGLENNVRNYRVWFEFLESLDTEMCAH
jgi:dipeptidyl aminopeptidase/acylaminoacyl peptidase